MKRLNFKLIGLTQLGIVLIAGALYFMHSWQVRRNANAILERAQKHLGQAEEHLERAEEKQHSRELTEAYRALREYVAFRPDDIRALELLAETLDQRQGASRNTLGAYENLLRRASTETDKTVTDKQRLQWRRRIVQVAIELALGGDLARFADAKDHLLKFGLLESEAYAKDGELRYDLGLCLQYEREFDQAAERYKEAIELAPQLVDSYARLAYLLRNELGESEEADGWIDELRKIDTYEAQFAASRYLYVTAGNDPVRLEQAVHSAIRAIRMAPTQTADTNAEEVDPFLLLSDIVRVQNAQLEADMLPAEQGPEGDKQAKKLVDEAYDEVQAVASKHEKRASLYLALAGLAIERDASETSEALKWLDQGIESLKAVSSDDKHYADLLWSRAEVLISAGRFQDAQTQIDELEKLGYAPARCEYLSARIQFRQGAWDAATERLERVRLQLADRPQLARQANMILAECYGNLLQPVEQLDAYRRVLSSDPIDIRARIGVATALDALGRLDEAITECDQALKLQGAHPSLRTLSQLIRLRRMRVIQRPPGEDRDWSEVIDLVRRLPRPSENNETGNSASNDMADPVAADVALVAAGALAAAGEDNEAIAWLEGARNRNKGRADVAAALARLYLRQGTDDETRRQARAKAHDFLEEAQGSLGDQVDLRLAWTDYWSAVLNSQQEDQKQEATGKLEALASNFDNFELPDQLRLLRGLAGVYEGLNLSAPARELWLQVIEREPSDLFACLEIFEIDRASWQQANYATEGAPESRAEKQRLEVALAEDIRRIDEIERHRSAGEAPYGPFGRYARAAQELDSVHASGRSPADNDQLKTAITYVDEALKVLPGWAGLVRLKADLLVAQSDKVGALENYRHAVQLGDRDPRVLRSLAMLLYGERRFQEADEVLQLFWSESSPSLSSGVARLWTWTLLRGAQLQRASVLAKQLSSSTDSADHLLLGMIYISQARQSNGAEEETLDQARAEFEQARQLAEDRHQQRSLQGDDSGSDEQRRNAWLAYIFFLVRTKQFSDAASAISEAQQRFAGTDASADLAVCWELLHEREQLARSQSSATTASEPVADDGLEKAERQLLTALENRPDDAQTLKAVAAFYLRHGREAEAAPHLRKLLQLSADDPNNAVWARRSLALVVGQSRQGKDFDEAMRLIEENLPADLRKRLDNAVRETSPGRQVPIQILESLLSETGDSPSELQSVVEAGIQQDSDLAVDFRAIAMLRAANIYPRLSLGHDRFLLAQLYRLSGQSGKARDAMLTLLGSVEDTDEKYPDYLAFMIDGMLRDGQLSEAGPWLDVLERTLHQRDTSQDDETSSSDPASRERWSFLAAGLRARFFAAQQKPDQAIDVINAYATEELANADAQKTRLRRAAGLLDQLGQSAVAEKLWRRLWEQSEDADVALSLALNLANQRRFKESLDLCEKVRHDCTPHLLASAAVAILQKDPAGVSQSRRVEPWLEEAMRSGNGRSLEFLTAMAAFRDLQGRYADEEQLYREILKIDQDHILALNNLAWLLAAHSGNPDEALALIDHAIDVAGASASLLDTRGTIYLRMGKSNSDKAIEDLRKATTAAPSAAKFFHLALAYVSVGKSDEAKAALQEAGSRGLSPAVLHPLEQSQYRALVAGFSGK